MTILPMTMRLMTFAMLLCSLFSSAALTYESENALRSRPRSLDAILVDPQEPEPQSSSHPFLKHLDLREITPKLPFLKHLDLRQVAAAQPAAAQPAANAQGNAGANQAANAGTDPNAQQVAGGQAAGGAPAAAPAPAAPVAGVGGGGAPAAAQPGANAGTANPVTVVTVQTVVGGVTKQVPQTYTQSFGLGGTAPAVQQGSIGMGTLTGKVGVVKTDNAKSEGVHMRDTTGQRWAILGVMSTWIGVMVVSGALLGARVL